MFIILVIVLVMILLFVVLNINTTNDSPKVIEDISINSSQETIIEVVPKGDIPKGGIAIFYRTSMNSVEERLPVFVDDVNDGGGYATNIRWESNENGVIRYIPSVNKLDVMGTTTSYSYSKAYISVHTIDGRVFLFRHRGGSSTLSEVDSRNAETKGSIPIDDVDFAVIGDDVYFREEIRKDLFDKRTGGGELFIQNLKEDSPRMVLDYGDSSNKGRFYGVSGSLISVLSDYSTEKDTIRIHNLQTGDIIKTIYQDIPSGFYFEGDDALYQIISDGKIYEVYRLSLQGQKDLVLKLELEEGEKGISIDQENGKLLIVSYKPIFEVVQILLYDMASNSLEEVPFEPFGSTSSPDYQFVILD